MDVRETQAAAIPGNEVALIERLRREHHEIDEQVAELERRPFLTADEDAELKRLKRLKLSKKDMIFFLSRRLGQAS
jgi:hypothetical protein